MKSIFRFFLLLVAVAAASFFAYNAYLGPTGKDTEVTFVVPQDTEGFEPVTRLRKLGLIKSQSAFKLVMDNWAHTGKLKPGGYRLNKSMDAFALAKRIGGNPDMIWVGWGGCLRKEQIGEILAAKLNWSKEELAKWDTVYTDTKPEYFEGVYYPDTYLIPVDEKGDKIASRLINRFNEKFAPYAEPYMKANIRWITGLRIASLIAREAAGARDMHLISGIIWNRLNIGMPLQIDATMQYTAGKNSEGYWWGPIDIEEKEKDSPYNSYLNKGLPPTPICSPSIDYIEAALNPQETDCLFYLHDRNGNIHCSVTYEEHLQNIGKYL